MAVYCRCLLGPLYGPWTYQTRPMYHHTWHSMLCSDYRKVSNHVSMSVNIRISKMLSAWWCNDAEGVPCSQRLEGYEGDQGRPGDAQFRDNVRNQSLHPEAMWTFHLNLLFVVIVGYTISLLTLGVDGVIS